MRPIVTEATVDADTLAAILEPRSNITAERAAGGGRFVLAEGPFDSYERRVTYTPADDGRFDVRQVVEAELAVPYWGWLFAIPMRRELAQLGDATPNAEKRTPWWAPPDRLDAEAARTLAALAMLSVVLGYSIILLSQLVTYAASEFHATKPAQGIGLAAMRVAVLLSFPLIALTDRRGRRKILLAVSAASCAVTALAALAPSLPTLIALQVPARALLTAAEAIILIVAAEEMPAGARAYAVGLLTMAGGLGGGLCVVLLPVADTATGAWRLFFALALFGLFPLRNIARVLPETRRFRMAHPEVDLSGHNGRLWLLAISAFLLAVFFTPAVQFTNEFLRNARGFDGARIALFQSLTNVPAAIGIIAGGRIADVRGRRVVAAVALIVGAGATVLSFVTRGWPMWAWSTFGSIVGAATVPALTVYGPELFPTSLRGRANAILGVLGRAGSVVGLVVVGVLSDRRGFGTAIGLVAIGPAILAVLVLIAYPETARHSLEDLNPEDA